MPERVSYGTSRSGERSTNGPYVSLSSAMSLLSQPSPHRAPRLRLVGHVSARTAFSALASPCASPTARRPRLSSNCFLSSNRSRCLRLAAEKMSGDDELLDLRGSLVELGDLGVPEVPLHRVFRDEAVDAVDLDGVRGHAHGHLGGEELGHGRLGAEGQTL